MDGNLVLPFTALAIGIKHGLDYDHIAAITDITAAEKRKARGVSLGFLYAVGHASVVALLALVFLAFGFALPEGMDRALEKVVGFTLVLLGLYVVYSLYAKRGEEFRLMPRWAVFANGLLGAYEWVMSRLGRAGAKRRRMLGRGYAGKSAYAIGMVHGVGSETPTQVSLFALALGTGATSGSIGGALIVLFFALGLVITNTLMAALGAYGLTSSSGGRLYRGVAFATGSFSILVGALFILGGAELLPELQALF